MTNGAPPEDWEGEWPEDRGARKVAPAGPLWLELWRFLVALVGLVGRIAFLALEVMFMVLVGFGAVISGFLRAAGKSKR